ncbi:MAG: CARDB domain-containing protein [bacterium]
MKTALRLGVVAALVMLVGCSAVEDPLDMGHGASDMLVFPPPVGGDLIISQLTVTSWTASGISYSYTVMNIGSAPVNMDGPTDEEYDNLDVQAFLSYDTIFNNAGDVAAGGTILGLSPLGYLDPGDTFSGSFSATPDADPCSMPYLTMKVDWGNEVSELDETNNTSATLIDICAPHIDIKPDSDINPINVKSKGVIPVLIIGSERLDVEAIIESTIVFGPAGAHIAHAHGHLADVNMDGWMDMVVHFRTQETGIAAGDTEACLTATLTDGTVFVACDDIVTVPVDKD